MRPLPSLVQEFASFTEHEAATRASVSTAPVGWHIEHSLLVVDVTISGMQKSDPLDYRRKFSFWKSLFFLLGRFPRGRGRAPKSVRPNESIDEKQLTAHLQHTVDLLKIIPTLNKHQYMKHPYFGMLHRDETVRFLELHTKHHLKIIRDILKLRNSK